MSRSSRSSHGQWPPWGQDKILHEWGMVMSTGWDTLPEEDVPLIKGSLVHQVVGIVCAGEWVIHRLALHNHWGVIGDNGVIEVIQGILELWMVRQRNMGSTESLRHQECTLKHENWDVKAASPRKHGLVALYMLCCLSEHKFCVIQVQVNSTIISLSLGIFCLELQSIAVYFFLLLDTAVCLFLLLVPKAYFMLKRTGLPQVSPAISKVKYWPSKSYLWLCPTVWFVFRWQVWDGELVIPWIMDPIVANASKCQLINLPSIRTLWNSGNDGFRIAVYQNYIWKENDTPGVIQW